MSRYSKDLFPEDIPLPLCGNSEHDDDPKALLKICVDGWVYYVLEACQDDLYYGLVIGHEIEMGYFTGEELRGVGARRDTQFQPERISVLRRKHSGDDDPTLMSSNPGDDEPPPTIMMIPLDDTAKMSDIWAIIASILGD